MRNPLKIAALGAAGLVLASAHADAGLILTGIIDGPLTGGTPKAVELFVTSDIPDLSIYGLESASNGAPASGAEFTFPAVSAMAGDYIYVATEAPNFTSYFGFAPDFTHGNAVNINGDDTMILYENGSISDVYGVIGVDGTGEPWEYTDSYAYRLDGTGPSATFDASEWFIPGTDVLDGTTVAPSEFGTYQAIPEPAGLAVAGLAGLALLRRRRA